MKAVRLLAMAAFVGMVSVALMAAEGDAPKKKKERTPALRGKIVAVDGATLTIMKMAREEADRKEVKVLTNAETKVTLDGAEAKVSDLAKDMFVSITPEDAGADKAAVKIVARKTMGKRKPKQE